MPRILSLFKKFSKSISKRIKDGGVFSLSDYEKELHISQSVRKHGQYSVAQTIAEITSSTAMSGSINVVTASSTLNVGSYSYFPRMNRGLFNSALHSGSTVIINDPASGSGIFVCGSFYDISGSATSSRADNFSMLKDAINWKIGERVADEKSHLTKAQFSSSYGSAINRIRNTYTGSGG